MFWNKLLNNRLRRAAGPTAVAAASLCLVTGCGLSASSPVAVTAHPHSHPHPVHAQSKGPLPVDLLIADRGNNRLLIVTPQKKIVWSMHIGGVGGPHNANSLGPDDAFFTPDGKHIIINEESNNMVVL